MAVAQLQANFKEGIEKEITCPLCLENFTDPKRLPCDHIYCKDPCLNGLVLRSPNSTITCPECRTVAQVPNYDVNIFPTAFQINRLKELYRNIQDNDDTDSPQTEPNEKHMEPATCKVHTSQQIALYCETCEDVLCRDCVLKSDKHKEHDYGYIEEVADKQRKAIASEIEPAKELEMQLSSALDEIAQEKERIAAHKAAHLDQIDSNFEATVNALTQEKELLKSRISQTSQHKTAAITNHEETLTTCLNELSDNVKQVESKCQNNVDFIRNKNKLVRQLQQASHKLQDLSLQPTEKGHLGLRLATPDKVRSCYKGEIRQYPLADPQKCLVKRFPQTFEVGKTCTATLQVRDAADKRCTHPQYIEVELKCIRNNYSVIQGEIIQSVLVAGNKTISVTPQQRGRHEVSMKVNNSHIAGSPFSVYVHKPPQQIDKPVSKITDVDCPAGLACFKENVYVISSNETISVFNERGERVLSHGFTGAREIAIDHETEVMFVTDKIRHQLHKLDKHFREIKSVGGRGTGPQQFNSPNGIEISRGGEVVVCDTLNHRIKVYDKELQLLRVIGEEGEKKGCFRLPDSLAFDASDNLFVTEQDNNRVQVIDPNGKTIRIIGKQGAIIKKSSNKVLKTPVDIAINGQYVYTTNWDTTKADIAVYTTKGEFVTTIGGDYLNRPERIAIDRDGYVYVSDNRENVIVF